jgi:acetyl esterase/lipase
MRWILLLLSAAAALFALPNVVRAPDTTLAWKFALAAGEFGHWLVLFPLGLAVLAGLATDGGWRAAILLLCVMAVAGFFRPAFSASRLVGGFSWARLYWHPADSPVHVQTEVYARPGGSELKLDYYAPPFRKDTTIRPPCLVVIHGGGWDSGDNTQLTKWNHRWAARGWAVAALNYRLAPAHPWPAQRDDVLAAVAWLKANADRLGLDPRRLVVLGRSAGGQIATAAAYGARDPDIRGVIALYAPHDMKFAWGVSREDDALNSIKLMRQYFGGPPDTPERGALYDSASGQLLARADSPPALLIHGYPDTLVWYRHSRRLTARLNELGVACTHVELPWATHAFDFNPDGPGGQVADGAIGEFLGKVGRE